MERTYIMIKPDGVQRGLVGEIIKRFEQKGFLLLAMKLTQPSKEHMEAHYEDLKEKKFFPGLIAYMTSGPVVAMVWSGKNVVLEGRKMLGKSTFSCLLNRGTLSSVWFSNCAFLVGATMPTESAMGTIRGDFCIEVGRNICHGSDAVESAEKEIAHWFPEGVASYGKFNHIFIHQWDLFVLSDDLSNRAVLMCISFCYRILRQSLDLRVG